MEYPDNEMGLSQNPGVANRRWHNPDMSSNRGIDTLDKKIQPRIF